MGIDYDKIDEVTLALLYLVIHDKSPFGARAWKGFDWETMNRLYEKGLIDNPRGKTKSVVMSAAAVEQSRTLFEKYFAVR